MNMKKLMLIVLLFSIAFHGFSQTDDTNKELLRTTEKILDAVKQQSDSARAASIRVTTSEIGLDVFDLALFRTIDVSYEYIKNSEFGFGLSARVNLTDEYSILSFIEKYSITPFFRYYFFNKQDYGSKGFYTEVFLKFFGRDVYDGWFGTSGDKINSHFDAALGIGLGYKFVSRSGFILDLNVGMGRSLRLSDLEDVGVARGGITFGYRF